jgi:hypothetical protein
MQQGQRQNLEGDMKAAATTFEELTFVTKLNLSRLNLSTERCLCCEKNGKQHYTMM